jgi:4'-phosphopantetheinyl transferase
LSRSTELPDGEVHLWHAWLRTSAEESSRLLGILSPDEIAAADNFTVDFARHQYVVSRAMLRTLLAQYAGVAPQDLRFGIEAMGKPILIAPHREIRFNLSHSGGLVVYGVARNRSVGADLERVRPLPRAIALARRYFSNEEAEAVELEPVESRDRKFLTFWVRRESGAKARGASVWRALERYGRGSDGDNRYARLRVDRDDPGWATISLDYEQEFVVSIVAKGTDWQLIQKGELKEFVA